MGIFNLIYSNFYGGSLQTSGGLFTPFPALPVTRHAGLPVSSHFRVTRDA